MINETLAYEIVTIHQRNLNKLVLRTINELTLKFLFSPSCILVNKIR
jgi:hypothetical protein